jgi:hypothetical protein
MKVPGGVRVRGDLTRDLSPQDLTRDSSPKDLTLSLSKGEVRCLGTANA